MRTDNMKKSKYYGLRFDGRRILLGRRPYSGFGVNYFGAFAHNYMKEPEDAGWRDAFATIKTYGIDFIRLPFGGYGPEYYEEYDLDREKMLSRLDALVAEAEKLQLGLIATLFWHDGSIPAHVGGKRADWGNLKSDTCQYALEYAATIVSRYRQSPAVWAWEIGNEFNLSCDLCDGKTWRWLPPWSNRPTGYDYYTSDELKTFLAAVSATIRGADSRRMISSGHGEMRPEAASLARASARINGLTHIWTPSFEPQTRAEFDAMHEKLTPKHIDTLSFHLQHGTSDGSQRYIETFERFGELLSQKQYFEAYKETAKKLGKALYFGEMGDYMELSNRPESIKNFRDLCFDITDAGICLASAWLFQDFDDSGMNGARLAVLGEANDELKAAGKARLDKYWPKVREISEKQTKKEKRSGSGLKTAALIAAAATVAAVAVSKIYNKDNSRKK
jgi:hypothetical protein